ncbi:beta-phosphoglucomutase [Anoxybacter fermentans]|uniref:Beta-phosphoglucomutase n=1 Tax=Anoxybacter fermentans TaxID=1323375 RepID=A0A3Q9HRE5_9FIRM|nr:beta-phosphoglucomutase [Anoxybacter fermentans]AZR72846.1 beta-phosphoglucomutase [Anoxybacter fermentans]
MDGYFKGVIFDLDGVITDTAEYHYQAWKRLAEKLGIPFDRKFNEKLKGVSRMESLNIILSRSNKSYTQEEKERLAEEKNADYKELIAKITPDDLLPGAGEVLESLKKHGYKLALASASKNASFVIKKLKVEHYFDYIVDAATIKNSKPHPEIFLTAAKGLGLAPEYCIGVEDAQAGIEAIKRAGMFAVGVGSSTLKGADVMINDLRDFDIEQYQTMVKR